MPHTIPIPSRFLSRLALFTGIILLMDRVLDNLEEYADELASLMTEKFEILACV